LVLLLIIIYVVVQTYIIANYSLHRKRMKETFRRVKKSANNVHRQVDAIIQDFKS